MKYSYYFHLLILLITSIITSFLLPVSLISYYLECKQLGKGKINMTVKLRNAPSTRAEFRVSDCCLFQIRLAPAPVNVNPVHVTNDSIKTAPCRRSR